MSKYCPGCGVQPGRPHQDDCKVYLARVPPIGTVCGREECVEDVPRAHRAPMTMREIMDSEDGGTSQVQAPTRNDPWAHRSAGMRCRTCMWWVQKRPDEAGILVPDKIIGRCRRHAPTISGFPVVFDHDWCGDHRLDEAKA